MKKFETLTEHEKLIATYSYYLTMWEDEKVILEKNPDDIIANARELKLKKICDELRAELIKLENQ